MAGSPLQHCGGHSVSLHIPPLFNRPFRLILARVRRLVYARPRPTSTWMTSSFSLGGRVRKLLALHSWCPRSVVTHRDYYVYNKARERSALALCLSSGCVTGSQTLDIYHAHLRVSQARMLFFSVVFFFACSCCAVLAYRRPHGGV